VAMVILLAAGAAAGAISLASRGHAGRLSANLDPPLAADTTVREPLQPLPRSVALDARAVALGRDLFHDTRLSSDRSIACANCHVIAAGGVDGLPRSIGVNAALGDVNAPTVLNSGFNFRQFWNGRAASLEEQIDGPTQSPKEMNSNWPAILAALRSDARYPARFASIYRDGLTAPTVRHAIATYERSLVTPSRFDRYLRGDRSAITPREQAGYHKFKTLGCASCHQGVGVGGNMYQVFGVMHDYFSGRDRFPDSDLGRQAITHDERDRHVFKVPSLRNVALTAPYFHDASAPTLGSAVSIMGWYQLGRPLTVEEVDLLLEFLGTLTGELPQGALPEGALPADTTGGEPS